MNSNGYPRLHLRPHWNLVMPLSKGLTVCNNLLRQDLTATILASCQTNKTKGPYKMCKSLPRNVRWPPHARRNLIDLSSSLNTLGNLWHVNSQIRQVLLLKGTKSLFLYPSSTNYSQSWASRNSYATSQAKEIIVTGLVTC